MDKIIIPSVDTENIDLSALANAPNTVTIGEHELHSYAKIYHLGHRYLENLLKGPVVVEEKVDGSQFSFGRRGENVFFRSRGATIYPETTDRLFKGAVTYISSVKEMLVDGWTYRGEVLHAPRHNTLTYSRTPKHNVVIFDIETDNGQNFLSPKGKELEAMKLDLECVPAFFHGEITDAKGLMELLETESFLGGCKLEGIVIKNYNQFGDDKKALMGKWVREEFKEIHQGAWKGANPSQGDVIQLMINVYKNENRWEKSIQHLREEGKLQNAPQDIGLLIKTIQEDLMAECAAEIKEKLYEYALPKILRGSTGGFPDFYKKKLAMSQFEEKPNE